MPFSRGSSWPRGWTRGSCTAGILYHLSHHDKYICIHMYVLSFSAVSNSLSPHGLQPIRLLCPWDSPGKNTGIGCHNLLQGIFPTQGSNSGLLHCRWILYQLSYQRSPRILELVAYPFSRESYQSRNQTGVSCIADGFFTSWATREVVYAYIEGNSNPL